METIEKTKRGTKRKMRPRGEPMRLVMEALAQDSSAGPTEVAKMTGLTPAYASKVMQQLKKGLKAKGIRFRKTKAAPMFAPGSAVARLMNTSPAKEALMGENRFIAAIRYVGVERAEAILLAEKARIEAMMGGEA